MAQNLSFQLNQLVNKLIFLRCLCGMSVIINLHVDSSIPLFSLDKARFAENIKELLRNSIRAEADKITITTQFYQNVENKLFVKIVIDDNGNGISDNVTLFAPFNSTHPQGTGLGLTTVRELIKAHGGTIEHKLKAAKGACFEINMPVRKIES